MHRSGQQAGRARQQPDQQLELFGVLPQAARPQAKHPTLSWDVAEIVNNGNAHSGTPTVSIGLKQYEVCANSLFIFPVLDASALAAFRLWVISLVEWKWFDKFILLLIFLNSVLLATYQYREDSESGLNWFVDNIADPVFAVFCTVELVLKVIAWGLILDKTSYLREPWNVLDFVVVVTALLTFRSGADSEGTSFLRLFRVLRPLRSLHYVKQMKVLVDTVLSSIPRLGNVSVMGAFLFVVFAIIGMTLYHGMYFNGCRVTEHPVLVGAVGEQCWSWEYTGDARLCGGRYDCKDPPEGVAVGFCGGREDSPNEAVRPVFLGGKRGFPWCPGSESKRSFPETEFVHFDNIAGALLTVFQSMTLEGWVFFMYYCQDGYGLWPATIYFLLLIFITSFTLLNVALAVVDEARCEFDKHEMDIRRSGSMSSIGSCGSMESRPARDSAGSASNATQSTDQTLIALPAPRSNTLASGRLLTSARSEASIARRFHARSGIESSSLNISRFLSVGSHEDVWLDVRLVHLLRQFVLNEVFTNFIMLIIAANVVVMMLDSYPPAVEMQEFQDVCEMTFLITFTVEMALLLVAIGPVRYWTSPVTAFDGLIVTISWIQKIYSGGGDNIFTALRTLRLFRVLNKLASRWPSFRVLIKAIIQTAVSLVYWFVLFILFLYIVTLAAMSLFNRQFHFKDPDSVSGVTDDQGEPWCNGIPGNVDCIPRAHFDTFPWALATVFQLMTGESWNMIMYAGMRANGGRYPWLYAIFFIGIILFGQLLFLSLFLSMLMSNFKRVQDHLEKMEREKTQQRLQRSTKRTKSETMKGVLLMLRPPSGGSTKLSKVLPAPEVSEDGGPADAEGEQEDEGDNDPPEPGSGVRRLSLEVKAMEVIGRLKAWKKRDRAEESAASGKSAGGGPEGELAKPEFHELSKCSRMPPPQLEASATGEVDSPGPDDAVEVPAPPGATLPGVPSSSEGHPEATARRRPKTTAEEQEEKYRRALKPWQADEPDSDQHEDTEATAGLDLQDAKATAGLDLQDATEKPADPDSKASAERVLKEAPEGTSSWAVSAPSDESEGSSGDPAGGERDTGAAPNQYQKWPHGFAWFLFPEDGSVRTVCRRILEFKLLGTKVFDNAVLVCILASCACMAIDSPLRDPSEFGTKVIRRADQVFAIVFAIEMVIKLLAYGLIWGRHAYLHSGWNWLDGIVVSVSVASLVAGNSGVVKTLRILRAFRPLRVISRNENLKVVVQTIFASLPDLFTLVIVACLFLLIFALFATSLLSGRLYACDMGDEVALSRFVNDTFVTPLCLGSAATQAACPRGSWDAQASVFVPWVSDTLSCPTNAANCANSGPQLTLAWQRASADTPICVGRCDPNREGAPEELCPRRFTKTDELPSVCPDRDTPEYQSRMQDRWGETYVSAEARGAAYVAAMQRTLVMPCGGSTVDATTSAVTNTASAVSCVRAFCPWVDSLPPEDESRRTCRSLCRKRTTIDFCFAACKEGKDFSSPQCQSCLEECEASCLCEDFCEPLIKDAALCYEQGGKWEQQLSQNFDNVWNSLLALFEISTTEGWLEVMYAASDATQVYVQPIRDEKVYIFVPFFMFWLFFSYMFLMNLSIGVIVDKFMDLKAAGKGTLKLSEAQQRWINSRVNLFGPALMWDLTNLHELSYFRRQTYELISHRCFDNAMMLAIAVNTLVMALKIYPAPTDWWEEVLEAVNTTFAIIFVIEAALKIYALRWNYFKDNWNRFDFLCAVGTTSGMLVGIATKTRLAPFTAVMRIFRIARLFRLMRFLRGLNKIFMALILAMPKLIYTLLILLLLLTLYGILGVSLFSAAHHSETLNVHGNFKNFFWAFITLFRASTGEAWNELMHDLSKDEADYFREGSWCTPAWLFDSEEVRGYEVLKDKCLIEHPNQCVTELFGWSVVSIVYWVTYTLFITIMVFNLMVAVILEGYEDGKPTMESEVVRLCQKVWKRYDPNQTTWLPIEDALDFIKDVQLLLENPGSNVNDLVNLWHNLKSYSVASDESDRPITDREERIFETGQMAVMLRVNRKSGRSFDLHAIPMRAVKALDVLHVSQNGSVHFLMAAKQLLRFESVDNKIEDFVELMKLEQSEVDLLQGKDGLDGMTAFLDKSMVAKIVRSEHKQLTKSRAEGVAITKAVAATKIQKFLGPAGRFKDSRRRSSRGSGTSRPT